MAKAEIGIISGAKLKALRRQRDLSLRDLEAKAGVCAGYLSKIERRGRSLVGARIVRDLARSLKVKLEVIGEIVRP